MKEDIIGYGFPMFMSHMYFGKLDCIAVKERVVR